MKPRHPKRFGQTNRWSLATTTLVVGVGLAGCGDEASPPATPSIDAPDAQGSPSVTPAHYRASLTFVGLGSSPQLLHVTLDNRISTEDARIAYRAWLWDTDSWTQVLNESEMLPLPRVAWRVIPTAAMKVIVGTAGDVIGLRMRLEDRQIRLQTGRVLASWAGASGQPESLRSASLADGEIIESGFVLARRGARSDQSPMPSSRPHALLVGDTLGNAFLFSRGHMGTQTPATGWTVIDGIENEWPDLNVADSEGATPAVRRWTITLPEAGITGELRGGLPFVDDLARRDSGVQAYRVTGFLQVGDQRRTVDGVGLEERGP